MRPTLLLALLLSLPTHAADRTALLEAEDSLLKGHLREARQQVDAYLAANPEDARGHFLRGVIKEQAGDRPGSVTDYDKSIALDPKFPSAYQTRGMAHFMLGHVKESVADFDKLLELRPDAKPGHWQRGIALYYAGRYEDGAKQFELHKTVNPDDVENAAWHFLCMARWKGVNAARAQLIPVTGDARVPMAQVQQLFAGKATEQDVLAAANATPNRVPEGSNRAGGESGRADPVLSRQLFYAHLYLGLYEEALNHPDKAKAHLTTATEKHPIPDYMYGVAKVHLQLLKPPTE
jgi:lipoprotein NlpI